MQLSVDIQSALDRDARLPPPADVERWVGEALRQAADARGGPAPDAAELSVRLVGEAESRALNARYRDRDSPTNVLSFPADLPPEIDCDLLGDLVICAPVVAREAQEQGKELGAHWAHMVVHGTLHLLGFDHETPGPAACMEALESRILQALGYQNPYI